MQTSHTSATESSALPPQTSTLIVNGMKCAGCVRAVENQLTQQPGVVAATVNLVTELATIEHDGHQVSAAALAHVLTAAGFPSEPRGSHNLHNALADSITETVPDFATKQHQELQQRRQKLAIAAILLLLSAIGHFEQFGWVTIPMLSSIWFHWGLATLALLGPGRLILLDGWQGLWRNIPNMNTLVGLGMMASYVASVVALVFPALGWECFFDEPVMLVGFILLGRTLEQQARGKAAAALQSLIELQPSQARLVVDPAVIRSGISDISESIFVPVHHVQLGQWLQVLPGEKIPVDGDVVAGHTSVNEAMLTGESIPVAKQPGDRILAGSLNQSGAIAIKATQIGSETVLAQIVNLVEAAQARKAPIQRIADTIAGYFAYSVITLAAITFIFWYSLGTSIWPHVLMTHHLWTWGSHDMAHLTLAEQTSPLLLSLKLAIAVLVIACPCALGLATPTAILVGSGIGAERGLLIRGGDVLENIHRLDTVIFDKTGTLTTGTPVVKECVTLSEAFSEPQLLQLAATVESGTRHPLAEAIQQAAQQQNLSLLPVHNLQTEPGMGVSAEVDGLSVILGTWQWLRQHDVPLDESVDVRSQTLAAGNSVVYLALGHVLIGMIAIQDTLRSSAVETVRHLHQMGLDVMMLTGDQPQAAQQIARLAGINSSQVLSEVRPEDKVNRVAQIQAQGRSVAMVGDGINDAPALAQANVGISMRSGTEVAVESADIILMRDRLTDIVESIHLGQATFTKIRQNLFWALAYNVLGIPIAAGVLLPSTGILLSPAAAGALMAFSSVSVVINSLLLRQSFR